MIYTLKCQFCHKVTAEVDIPAIEKYVPLQGIADVRCSDCEVQHGSYKEMAETYEQEIGGSNDEFRTMMEKVGWSKPAFNSEVVAIKAARAEAAALQDNP